MCFQRLTTLSLSKCESYLSFVYKPTTERQSVSVICFFLDVFVINGLLLFRVSIAFIDTLNYLNIIARTLWNCIKKFNHLILLLL